MTDRWQWDGMAMKWRVQEKATNMWKMEHVVIIVICVMHVPVSTTRLVIRDDRLRRPLSRNPSSFNYAYNHPSSQPAGPIPARCGPHTHEHGYRGMGLMQVQVQVVAQQPMIPERFIWTYIVQIGSAIDKCTRPGSLYRPQMWWRVCWLDRTGACYGRVLSLYHQTAVDRKLNINVGLHCSICDW